MEGINLSLQAMVDRGPEWLSGHLLRFEQGAPIPENSVIGILDAAASQAHHLSSLEWAGIAIRAAELMALTQKDRDFALQRAMLIRARFIAARGSIEGDRILDRDIVVQWFKNETTLPIAVAKERSVGWRESPLPAKDRLPIDQLRELRTIRQRIQVLQVLWKSAELPDDPMLTEWLEIASLLP